MLFKFESMEGIGEETKKNVKIQSKQKKADAAVEKEEGTK